MSQYGRVNKVIKLGKELGYEVQDDSKHKMDSYLSRFEKYATANKWDPNLWAAYLSALLEGQA